MLSDEFLEKRQSFFLQLSGNYERTFLQRHTITFLTAKISSQTSIFCNLVSLFIWRGFKKKSIKLLAKPRTDAKKVSFI